VLFLFKILHNLTCVPLSDITLPNTTTTAESVITRRFDANNISVPLARTDTYQHSFGPDVCKNWNNLPSYIKEITSIEQFKNQIIV